MNSMKIVVNGLAGILLLACFSTYAADHRKAPLIGQYNFLLEIEGVMLGRFASVDGLGAEIEVVEFREGGEGGLIRKIPGRTTYSNITLKRGYTASNDLWNWMQEIIDGNFVAKNGSIIVAKGRESEIVRFHLINAWPIKYEVGTLKAKSGDVAIEELTLTVEKIELD